MFEFIPARVVFAIWSFLGFINLYLVRFSFTVISVAMITPHEKQQQQQQQQQQLPQQLLYQSQNESCGTTGNCSTDTNVGFSQETLDWDERTRSLVIGIFNYGYCLTQVLGGRLAERYGAKYLFGCAITLPAFFSFFIPMGAKASYWWVVAIRFLQGVIQGVSWPSMNAALTQWIPPNERSKFAGTVILGSTFGMVFILPFTGFLCDTFSWETATYITAAFPLVWGVFWFSLIYSKPSQHPRITKEEKKHIQSKITAGGTRRLKHNSVPWRSVATSVPFIAIVICDIGNSYGWGIYSSQMTNFISSVFKYSVTKTGFIAGLPFLFRYCGSCIFSCIADFLISRKLLSVGTTRRIFSVIAMFGPSLVMLNIILFALSDSQMFSILICVALFFNGGIAASQVVNGADIAPNYAGTLYGISNSFASVTTFVCVFVTGEILNNEPTLERWTIVFWICIPVMVVTELFYLVFMSGEVQPWNFYAAELDEQKEEERMGGEGCTAIPDETII